MKKPDLHKELCLLLLFCKPNKASTSCLDHKLATSLARHNLTFSSQLLPKEPNTTNAHGCWRARRGRAGSSHIPSGRPGVLRVATSLAPAGRCHREGRDSTCPPSWGVICLPGICTPQHPCLKVLLPAAVCLSGVEGWAGVHLQVISCLSFKWSLLVWLWAPFKGDGLIP